MNAMKQFLGKQRPRMGIAAFLLSFLAVMAYLAARNVMAFHHDALMYWTIGEPVFEDGFHLLHYPESFRGCLQPILLCLVRLAGRTLMGVRGEFIAFRVATAAVLSLFFSVVLPSLFGKKVSTAGDCVRIVAVTLAALYFWGDFFTLPLSDFAPVFCIAAALALVKSNLGREKGRPARLVQGVLAGMALYTAYNIRVAYLYAGILVLAYIAVSWKLGKRTGALFLLGMLAGGAAAALPQSLVNHQYTHSYRPKVYTEQLYGYKTSLEKQQVLWGISWYDVLGYVGPEEEHPTGGIVFDDKTGGTILLREGLFNADLFSYAKFFKLFLKYPLDMVSVYVRHFVLLMTPKYPEVFITDMYPDKGPRVSAIIVLWFAALCTLLLALRDRRIDWELSALVLIALLPSLMQLLGAPELRFFVGVHMFGYFYVLYYVDYSKYAAVLKQNALPLLVCFVVFACLWIGVLSSLLNGNTDRPLLINDRNIYRPAHSAPAK